MVPGTVYEVTVSLWNTSFVWAPGHSIRVDISSSNWPRFLPNPNNGLPLTQQGPNITAQNSLYMGGATPSAVLLPVVDMATQLPPFSVLETLDTVVDLYMSGMSKNGYFEHLTEEQTEKDETARKLKLRGAEAKAAPHQARRLFKQRLMKQLQEHAGSIDSFVSIPKTRAAERERLAKMAELM